MNPRYTAPVLTLSIFATLVFGLATFALAGVSAADTPTAPTAELISALKKVKDGPLPQNFDPGRGVEFLGDYIYLSGITAGTIHYFKRDVKTGTVAYVGAINDTTIKSMIFLKAAGGHLYGLGWTVWGVNDDGKCKGLSWYDIEPGTGKPVQKGTLDVASAALFNARFITGPEGKELYGLFNTAAGVKLTWVKLAADGTPSVGGEVAGQGLSENLSLSPDGKFIYSVADHKISIIDRKPTGEIAYKGNVSLDPLYPIDGPKAENERDLRPSLAGISPDGKWFYLCMHSNEGFANSYFAIYKRDVASGELTLSEGGSASNPVCARFANLAGMELQFLPGSSTKAYLTSGSCLLQSVEVDGATGRLSVLSDLVLGKAEEVKCRPIQPILFDFKNGLMYGMGVWQTGSYGEHQRGLWTAKLGTTPATGERADLKATVASAADAKPANEADWPCWRGPNGDGKVSLKGIRKDWSGGLRKVWDVAGLSPGDVTWSAPIVQGNKLFVMGTHGFVDELFCFDADKGGRPLWISELPGGGGDVTRSGGRDGWCGGPVATPYASGDKIYVTVGGRFTCFQAADGKVLWRKNVLSACHVYAASPLAWDGVLIVPGIFPPGEKPSLLAGLKADSGEIVWRYGVGEPNGGDSPTFGHVSPLRMKINGVEQVVYNTGALACGLDPKTGKPYWEHRYVVKGSNVNATEPVTDGSILAVMLGDGEGSPMGVQIENNTTAKPLWGKKGFRAMWSDPILRDGFLYMFASDGLYSAGNSDFRCVDIKTGDAKWIEKKTGCGTTVEVDGSLLCLTYSGDLWLLNPTPEGFKKITEWKGAIKTEPWWTANGGNSPAPCWSVPVIARGKLYLRYSNTLACYDLLK